MKEMTVGEPSEQLYRMVPLSLDNAEIASRDVSVEDRAYVNGARQAQSIAHQSLIALDKWIADGCGNRIATLKPTGLLKEIEDAQRTAAEMPQDLRRSLGLESNPAHEEGVFCMHCGVPYATAHKEGCHMKSEESP